MAGPWEKYAQEAQPVSAGPWSKYGGAPAEEPGLLRKAAGAYKDFGTGFLKGAADIGATLLYPVDKLTDVADRIVRERNPIAGDTAPTMTNNQARRAKLQDFLRENTAAGSLAAKGGELAANVAGTVGVGGLLARGAQALGAGGKLVSALESGGFTLGSPAATTLAGRAGDAAIRAGAGGAGGAAAAGLVNPNDVVAGGAIGAALPGVIRGSGALGGAVGRTARSMVEPFTDAGRQNIRSRFFNELLGQEAPKVAQNLREAYTPFVGPSAPGMQREFLGEIVPGSLPTAAQAGGNANLNALENALFAANPEVKNALTQQFSAQNAARINVLEDLAGTGGRRDMLDSARNATAKALYKKAYESGIDLSRLETGVSPFVAAKAGQTAASATAKEPEGIIAAIRKLGGVNSAGGTMRDITGEDRVGKFVKGIPPGFFNSKGKGLDDLASQLRAKGYLIADDAVDGGVQSLKNMIRDEIEGITKHVSGAEQDRMFASMASSRARPQVEIEIPKSLTRAGDKINAMWDRPAMRSAVNDAVILAKNEGVDLSTEAGTVKGLDYVGRALQDQIKNAVPGSNQARVLIDLREQFLNNLAQVSPKYDKAMKTFAQMSKPVNEMDVVNQIRLNSLNPLTGELSAANYARSIGEKMGDKTAASATGYRRATLENQLTPQVAAQLRTVLSDLRRASDAQRLGRGINSDTVNKLAYNNMAASAALPRMLVNSSLGQGIGTLGARAADLVYGDLNRRIAQEIGHDLLTPRSLANLIQRTGSARTQNKQLSQLLENPITRTALIQATAN